MRRSVSGRISLRRSSASFSWLISPAHSRCESYGRCTFAAILRLRLGDRALEVAPADAELHRRVALAVLAVDDRSGPPRA